MIQKVSFLFRASPYASCEFQSPNSSWAMLSGLIYRLSAVHSLASSFSVVEVLPEPLGPATTQSTGLSSLILVVL